MVTLLGELRLGSLVVDIRSLWKSEGPGETQIALYMTLNTIIVLSQEYRPAFCH